MEEFLAALLLFESTDEQEEADTGDRVLTRGVADVLRYETLAVLDNGHIVLCWQRDVSLGANDHSMGLERVDQIYRSFSGEPGTPLYRLMQTVAKIRSPIAAHS
jgi:hypothetical protein